MKKNLFALMGLVLLAASAGTFAQQAGDFIYTNNGNSITITRYTGNDGNVVIPSTITNLPVANIDAYAFNGCSSLTTVTIPSSVTSVGYDAFGFCTNLNAITVDPLNPCYSSLDGVLFDKNQITLIKYPCGRSGKYAIPNSVTSIASCALSFAMRLTDVWIPNSVTNIGDFAFTYCYSLTNVALPTGIVSMGDEEFGECVSLPSITIPGSFGSIGNEMFWGCSSLTNVTIPNSVTSISNRAFYYCSGLTYITIPNSVTNIVNDAFNYCHNLKGIFFRGDSPSVTPAGWFSDGNFLEVTVYYLPGTTGWSNTFAGFSPIFPGYPTLLWNPSIQVSNAHFGVQTNNFCFNITGNTNIPIVVEGCSNLVNATWFPLQSTNIPASGSFYFSDPHWINYPACFYRIRSP